MVLRRELCGNAVDEKSIAVGIGVGYQVDPRWAKKSTPPVRGGILKNHLSCTVSLSILQCYKDILSEILYELLSIIEDS